MTRCEKQEKIINMVSTIIKMAKKGDHETDKLRRRRIVNWIYLTAQLVIRERKLEKAIYHIHGSDSKFMVEIMRNKKDLKIYI